MTLASPSTRFSPDDLLRLESEGLFELVDGKLVEKQMGATATKTAVLVSSHLFLWTRNFELGEVYSEQTFQCFPGDPNLLRRPDVALILRERLPGVAEESHIRIAPDLAVEVVSPNDKIYELDEKLADYRSAGVRLVWVINPRARMLRVHRLDHTVSELWENDLVSGEDVLPRFSVALKEMLSPSPRV